MATFKFQGLRPFPTLSFISLTMFLLVLNKANSIETISFNYTKFHQGDEDVILQGDARITRSGVLKLSREDENGIPIWNSTGRALYAEPVHIWDSTTDRVASFETRFSIAINQTFPYIYPPADGLAFFLAPFSSQPAKGGGLLGIFDSPYKDKQVLAVEFDTYPNPYFDPPQVPHIGLDVKSIRSIKTSPFDLDNGKVANVVVTYYASSKILHAALVYPSQGTIYTVAEIVDVKQVLPEWVYVGFSASTGDTPNAAETHDVLSWSFTSTLAERNDIVIATLQNHTTTLVQQ